jgi:pimeloyl-ACP methyl ester carboxylesterase
MESDAMSSVAVPAARPARGRFRWLFRSLLLLALAGTGLAAYMGWIVARFDTETPPARHGQVDAKLFAADGPPRPLIVALGGSEGGNAWASERWKPQRDRFVAQGHAVLALEYFGGPRTPAQLDRISVDAVHAAILEAARDPRVDGRCIAVVGGSRGAELALLLGSHYPDIGAVVALVPGSAVFPSLTDAMVTPGFSLGGRPLPFVPVPWSATPELLAGDLRGAFEDMMDDKEAMQAAAIPVERIGGPVLFVSATRDEVWPSREMADAMMVRLRAHGFAHVAEHWPVEGGHAEPLDAFPRIESFLAEHFAKACR